MSSGARGKGKQSKQGLDATISVSGLIGQMTGQLKSIDEMVGINSRTYNDT
jgi:phage-related protein